MSISNRSGARLGDSSRNRAFWRGTQRWYPRTEDSFDLRVKVYVFRSLKLQKKSLKPPILGVQGRLRSSMLVPPESLSAVLVMISCKSVSAINRSHARRVNNGKITISKGRGYPSLMPLFEGNFLTQRQEICSQETRDYHTIETRCPHLTWIWFGTRTCHQDGQTDKQTDRQTDRETDRQNYDS